MNRPRNVEANGELIRQIRRRLGWTQTDLAKKAGYSERLISKAEAGKSVAASTLKDICSTFAEAGAEITIDDVAFDPVAKAREFIKGMYIHKADVIDQCQDFISDDVIVDINGDPNIFPFAGHHVGIEAARNAFRAFYSVLQPPEDMSELDAFQFVSTGTGVVVWGDTWTHPIGRPITEPVRLAIRMDFRNGLLVHFDDRFDVSTAEPHFHSAGISKTSGNAELIRQWFQSAFNERNLGAIERFMHPNILLVAEGKEVSGHDAIRTRVKTLLDAFDPIRITVDQIVSEGDTVVCYWQVTKTHIGEFASVPATGKTVCIRGSSMAKFEDGKIIEARDHWDISHLIEKLKSA